MGLFSRKPSIVDLVRNDDYQSIVNRHRAGKEPVVQQLSALLDDEEMEVRASAAYALEWIAKEDVEVVKPVIPKLTALLNDEKGYVRWFATMTLRSIAEVDAEAVKPIVPNLVSRLDDKDHGVRLYSAWALANIAEADVEAVKPAVPKLISLLDDEMDDENDRVRNTSAYTLATIAKVDAKAVKPAVPRLIALLDDENDNVRANSTLALANIAEADVEAVKPAVPKFIALLDDKADGVRRNSVWALAKIAKVDAPAVKPALPKLIALLDDENDNVRWDSAFALANIAEADVEAVKPAVPKFIALLDDKADGVRRNSVWALAKIAKVDAPAVKPALPKLIALLDDENDNVRANSTLALANIAEADVEAVKPAVPKLISLLDDENDNVRWDSAFALRSIAKVDVAAAKPAAPKLIALLRDKTDGVRWNSAAALGHLAQGDAQAVKSALPELIVLLDDRVDCVRQNSAWALGYLAEVDTHGAKVAVSKLQVLLEDPDERVRGNAKWALSQIHGAKPETKEEASQKPGPHSREYGASEDDSSSASKRAGNKGRTGPFSPPPAGYAFPKELEHEYHDCSPIGEGGFAKVFCAKRRSDGTEVAIKVPVLRDAATGKSFIKEITAWQHLKHPNVVQIYDFNILPIPYFEMELCQRHLGALPMPLAVEHASEIMFHVSEGLKHAHSKGIIHRDLKPHNILLQGETPKITDWGLSKVVAESKGQSSSKAQTFSLYWAAPEQLSSKEYGRPDHRTDIWQLGVIFYQLVTGDLPFDGDSVTEVMAHILMGEPELPSAKNPAAGAVEPIIMKCLHKQMKDRYQSVAEMQRDLADYLKIEYRESLSKSQGQGNMQRSGYYCAELCLVNLIRGEIGDALKYAKDLNHYAGKAVKDDLDRLISELEFRSKEGKEITEELMERAGSILHQARMGW